MARATSPTLTAPETDIGPPPRVHRCFSYLILAPDMMNIADIAARANASAGVSKRSIMEIPLPAGSRARRIGGGKDVACNLPVPLTRAMEQEDLLIGLRTALPGGFDGHRSF